MSNEDWKFTPFCPIRPGEDCNYRCGFAVRINRLSDVTCALALLAAKGTAYCVNVARSPEWGTE